MREIDTGWVLPDGEAIFPDGAKVGGGDGGSSNLGDGGSNG